MRHIGKNSQTSFKIGLITAAMLLVVGCSNSSSDPFKGDDEFKEIVNKSILPSERVLPPELRFNNSEFVVNDKALNKPHLEFPIGEKTTRSYDFSLKQPLDISLAKSTDAKTESDLAIVGAPNGSTVIAKIINSGKSLRVTMTWEPSTQSSSRSMQVILNPVFTNAASKARHSASSPELNVIYATSMPDDLVEQDINAADLVKVYQVDNKSGNLRPADADLVLEDGANIVWKVLVKDANSDGGRVPRLVISEYNNVTESRKQVVRNHVKYSWGHLVDKDLLAIPSFDPVSKTTEFTLSISVDALKKDLKNLYGKNADLKEKALSAQKMYFFLTADVVFVGNFKIRKSELIKSNKDFENSENMIQTEALFEYLKIITVR